MSIETAIRTILTTDATVSALVGSRVYPTGIPQGQSGSAIVYQQIDGRQDQVCDGLTGLDEDIYQFTAWTIAGNEAAPAAALTLIRALRAAFFPANQPYTGVVGDVTIKAVEIAAGIRDASFLTDNIAEQRYGKQMDLTISYTT